ncbi:hypothetical protein IQ255_28470 [Pleurocapsales cyanobacterium LEGE 10410]|nr:hypothetical protein [Pleurocapsales cyanobacterium LEGE 10410]
MSGKQSIFLFFLPYTSIGCLFNCTSLSPESLVMFDDAATQTERSPLPTPMLQPPARNWYKNADGTVVLTARTAGTTVNNSALTAVDCKP